MKRGQKSEKITVTKVAEEPVLSIPQYLDRAVHYRQIRPEQRAEIAVWFQHHGLKKATIPQFDSILQKY